MPPAKATGAYTASTTSVAATSAPESSRIVPAAASAGERPSASRRTHDSVTQIALSTTDPITSTNPNSVSVFTDIPNASRNANVPTSETGIASAGISVARQLPRNSHVIPTTSRNVSTIVHAISRIEAATNVVESYATSHVIPSGISAASSPMRRFTASITSSELAPADLYTVTATAMSPWKRLVPW